MALPAMITNKYIGKLLEAQMDNGHLDRPSDTCESAIPNACTLNLQLGLQMIVFKWS